MEAYPEDSGPYSVLVQNPAGEARSSCQLTIEQIYSSTGYIYIFNSSQYIKLKKNSLAYVLDHCC